MKDHRILYLSISHYNTPKDPTISRKVHYHPVSASTPVSLRYEIKEHKYVDYKPVLLEVFKINLNTLTITEVSKDTMTPPTDKQLSFIKGICETLDRPYNEPKTKVEASAWLNYYVPIYRKKCEEQELEWEANHSEIMDNWGDWQ
jgi:hypothetical protein